VTENVKAGDGLTVEGWGARPHWGVYASLFLTSAALLCLEVSLTRFFSYTIWYHFAYLTISVALLGFGSSGAFIAAFPDFFARRGRDLLVYALALAAGATVGGLVYLGRNPLEVMDLTQAPARFFTNLLVYYCVVGAPFLLAGFSISLPFAAYPRLMGRLYFWDLIGGALGCGLVVWLIESLSIPGLIIVAGGLMLGSAAALSAAGRQNTRGMILGGLAVVLIVVSAPFAARIPVSITSTKGLTTHMSPGPWIGKGAPAFEQRTDRFTKWTAINRVDAFGWDYPGHFAFWNRVGLSNSWTGPKPLVARLFYDGSNGSEIYPFEGDIDREYEFLEHHMLRLPYLILQNPNVLAIGVGGGIDLLNAIKQGARHVTGAELQPETVNLLKNRLQKFNNGFYRRDDVTLVASEGRHFVRKTDQVFDLIQITSVDTFAAQATGAYVLAESYLYTVEAMGDYFERLAPDGLVAIVVGDIAPKDELPPLVTRGALIAYRALQKHGVRDPGQHLIVVGAISTGLLAQNEAVIAKKTPFLPKEVATIEAFVAENGFKLLYAPGSGEHRMSVILGPDEDARQRTMDAEWFNVEATYDSNPFYYNVGKWKNLSSVNSIAFSMPGSFIGQVVLILMVVQATLLGAVLVIFPLMRGARTGLPTRRVLSYLAYFLALGVGFMFIEISFVQSFVLFLGSPTYALSVTIFSLLLFSGVGSLISSRFVDRAEWALTRLVILAAGLVVAYTFGLPLIFDAALHLDIPIRVLIAVAAQMPIGLTLGMFMPLGVACVAREHPRLVPWAWGINSVGSVTGTTLAVLLAMSAGFRVVSLTAAALYLMGTAFLLRTGPRSEM